MKIIIHGIIALAVVCLFSTYTSAQRNIVVGSPVTENFGGFGTGTVNLTDNSTILGVYAARTTGNLSPNVLPANDGTTSTGQLYNMGSTGSGDRALGTISANSSGTSYLGIRLFNSGITPITSLQVMYTGEQWRHGNGANETLTFDYQTAASVTSLTTGSWTAVPALNFLSPTNPAGQGALDGNDAANRTTLTTTISVTIPAGTEIMLRWVDLVESAQPDGFGIDDISITAIGPSAGSATISGRVVDANGRGIGSALITIQDLSGGSRKAITNSFGYFNAANLAVGGAYVVGVSARRYTFATNSYVVDLSDNIGGVNFVALR